MLYEVITTGDFWLPARRITISQQISDNDNLHVGEPITRTVIVDADDLAITDIHTDFARQVLQGGLRVGQIGMDLEIKITGRNNFV